MRRWKSFLTGLYNWPNSQCGRMAISWMFCYLWLLDVLVGHTRGHSLFSCEPIILRMCQDLPYNTTFMPNLLNHYDQQTAALAMEVRLVFTAIYMFLAFTWQIIGNRNQEDICIRNKNEKIKIINNLNRKTNTTCIRCIIIYTKIFYDYKICLI